MATTRAQLVAVDKEARCNNNARKVKVINAFETSAPGTFADKLNTLKIALKLDRPACSRKEQRWKRLGVIMLVVWLQPTPARASRGAASTPIATG